MTFLNRFPIQAIRLDLRYSNSPAHEKRGCKKIRLIFFNNLKTAESRATNLVDLHRNS